MTIFLKGETGIDGETGTDGDQGSKGEPSVVGEKGYPGILFVFYRMYRKKK